MVRVIILWGLGINCEEETKAAYELAGAETSLVHINELFSEKINIYDFHIVHFPGGFSFGDNLGAGRVLANRMRFKKLASGFTFLEKLLLFVERGGFIFGICNGFQILTNLGLLPGLPTKTHNSVTLIENNNNSFQDQWVLCCVNQNNILAKLWPEEYIYLPIRHQQGCLYVPDAKIKEKIKDNNLIAITYAGENPNGSFEACAALSDPSGRILGMMPHPEAYISAYNHPEWPRHAVKDTMGQGLGFFLNLVKYVGA